MYTNLGYFPTLANVSEGLSIFFSEKIKKEGRKFGNSTI